MTIIITIMYDFFQASSKKFRQKIELFLLDSNNWNHNEMQFLTSSGRVDTTIWMHYMDAD